MDKVDFWIKGLWIPGEVAFNDKLSYFEKFLFAVVDLMDGEKGCFASNEYLAGALEVSARYVSDGLAKLIEAGYIDRTEFNGRQRILKINFKYKQKYQHLSYRPTNRCSWQSRTDVPGRVEQMFALEKKERKEKSLKRIVLKDDSRAQARSATPCNQNTLNGRSLALGKAKQGQDNPFKGFTEAAQNLFEFWNSQGAPLPKHQQKGKTFIACMKAAEVACEKHKLRDIKRAILNYKELLTSKDTSVSLEIPGHRVGLDEFFGFSSYTKQRMAAAGVEIKPRRSWFYECLPPKDPFLAFEKIEPDYFPAVTAEIMRLWGKRVLRGIKTDYDGRALSAFRRAGARFNNWMEKNKAVLDLDLGETNSIPRCVHYLFDALEEAAPDFVGVHPGWLANDVMFQSNLPNFFRRQNMTTGDDVWFKGV